MFNIDYCPSCGFKGFDPECVKSRRCGKCGFVYFHNIAAAAAGIFEVDNKILLTTRAHDPMAGKLDLPGGFCDHDETAEQTLIREVKEELGIEISNPQYFCSQPNEYRYKHVLYYALDIVFIVKLDHLPEMTLSDEIQKVQLFEKDKINYNDFAFPSTIKSLKAYLNQP